MSAHIEEGVPGQGGVRVVLKIRPGVYGRGDLALAFPHGATARVELSPREVRLVLALVLAYHLAPPPQRSADAALFGETSYRGQVSPEKLGQLYARVLRPSATITPKSVRSYVSEFRKHVRKALDELKDPQVFDPDVITGGDGYRIGPYGIEVLDYPHEREFGAAY
jgi:gamma-glutamylcyclotransferase (GGCT)/AIG2-like uncharacterized protein YtfP